MGTRRWQGIFRARVNGPQREVFDLLADMRSYSDWLPGSVEFADTVDVEPYPVRLGSLYRDGRPDEARKYWLGSVTGFQPPGSLDFEHTIEIPRMRATLDAHIHYSIEADGDQTLVARWYLLDVTMPTVLLPARLIATRRITTEGVRLLRAVQAHFEG